MCSRRRRRRLIEHDRGRRPRHQAGRRRWFPVFGSFGRRLFQRLEEMVERSVQLVAPSVRLVGASAPLVVPSAPLVVASVRLVGVSAPLVVPSAPLVVASVRLVGSSAPLVVPSAPLVGASVRLVVPSAPLVVASVRLVGVSAPLGGLFRQETPFNRSIMCKIGLWRSERRVLAQLYGMGECTRLARQPPDDGSPGGFAPPCPTPRRAGVR